MKTHLRNATVIGAFVAAILFSSVGNVLALDVKILVNPIPTTVPAGSDPIDLIAKPSGYKVPISYEWNLIGPGKLAEMDGLPNIAQYTPPKSLVQKPGKATVTLTVVDGDGTSASHSVALKIVANPSEPRLRIDMTGAGANDDMVAQLLAANIILTEVPGNKKMVERWLRTDSAYIDLADKILELIGGGKLVGRPVPIEVIEGHYRLEKGVMPSQWLPPPHDIAILKSAIFNAWQERNPNGPEKTFYDIVASSSSIAANVGSSPEIYIVDIKTNKYITGRIAGLDPSSFSEYKVLVYAHTDKWYIHPYASGGDGLSYAAIKSDGSWTIQTVKRGFDADEVAALLVDKSYSPITPVQNIESLESTAMDKEPGGGRL